MHIRSPGAPKRAQCYQDTAEQCDDGLVTEAITAMRGRLVHDFVNGFRPQSGPIYPQPDLYPSEDLCRRQPGVAQGSRGLLVGKTLGVLDAEFGRAADACAIVPVNNNLFRQHRGFRRH